MEKQENIVRTVLKNEVTWILGILVAGWGVVTQIILPISVIQTQLAQIQQNQQDGKKFQQQITTIDDGFNSRISVLEALNKVK